jgi:hypothetical protein
MSSFFTKSINTTVEPVCAHCQSTDMLRAISTFATGRSSRPAQDNYSSEMRGSPQNHYPDPRNIGRHVEDSYSRHGVEMPESVRNTIQAAREGTLPKGLDI